jgi:formylglycine-generating enzyme required for sulfatase activity
LPTNATNKTIVWTVASMGITGATVSGNTLNTTTVGTVSVTATIINGLTASSDYTEEFMITVTLPPAGQQKTVSPAGLSDISFDMHYVPAGSFQRDGTAANITIITKGYWMGETEVTKGLFDAVMGSGHYNNFTVNPEGGAANLLPVEEVRWYGAIAFCNKLSIKDGKEPVYSVSGINDWENLIYSAIPIASDTTWNGASQDLTKNGYRLPTEMEWMWAAMGADKTVQPNTTGYSKAFAGSTGGNSIGDYAWYNGNASSKTHQVGVKTANELGLKDMSGNVYEWCWDWYNSSIAGGTLTDPAGAASGSYRVLCGGSSSSDESYCRVAYRGYIDPNGRYVNLGFRVACP